MVERHSDEATRWRAFVPIVNELSGERGHAFLGLETGMQKPKTGDFCGLRREFCKAVDEGFETGDTIFDF